MAKKGVRIYLMYITYETRPSILGLGTMYTEYILYYFGGLLLCHYLLSSQDCPR